jgi:PTS system mannose-specific IID component
MRTEELSTGRLTHVVLRNLLIQAAWNYDNFQGVGFAYAVLPSLRTGSEGEADERPLLQRHMKFFNTNPYLAGMIIGGTLRLEEERREDRITSEQIDVFKNDLMGALGALGDSFIWGALRPLVGLLAVLVAILFETIAPLVFLVLYNGVTLWLRFSGVKNGYRHGFDVLRYLKDLQLQRKIHWMNGVILFLVGAFLPLWGMQILPLRSFAYFGLCGFLVLVLLGVWSAERKGVSLFVQVICLLLLSQGLAFLGWISFS